MASAWIMLNSSKVPARQMKRVSRAVRKPRNESSVMPEAHSSRAAAHTSAVTAPSGSTVLNNACREPRQPSCQRRLSVMSPEILFTREWGRWASVAAKRRSSQCAPRRVSVVPSTASTATSTASNKPPLAVVAASTAKMALRILYKPPPMPSNSRTARDRCTARYTQSPGENHNSAKPIQKDAAWRGPLSTMGTLPKMRDTKVLAANLTRNDATAIRRSRTIPRPSRDESGRPLRY
mmetsp:Transcript_34257/g.94620  ORF Transcript_34257/g.94620 Transcript_34257/m.94620 type:complete len:236 (+) Transcript_34257:216-923(+)